MVLGPLFSEPLRHGLCRRDAVRSGDGSAMSRLNLYFDVRAVLDEALAAGGGTFTLSSHGAAVNWRQRAYKFRKLYAESIRGESKYDVLTLPRIAKDGCTVTINITSPRGIFTPTSYPVPVPAVPEAEDDLQSEANRLAKELGIDI